MSKATSHLNDLWGAGPADIYAVGAGGLILHYDGLDWRALDSGTTLSFEAIWGLDAAHILAGGEGGMILHRQP